MKIGIVNVKHGNPNKPKTTQVSMLIYKDFGIKHCENYHAITLAAGMFEGYHIVSFDTLTKCYKFIKQLYIEDGDFIKKTNEMPYRELYRCFSTNLRRMAIEMGGETDNRVI